MVKRPPESFPIVLRFPSKSGVVKLVTEKKKTSSDHVIFIMIIL